MAKINVSKKEFLTIFKSRDFEENDETDKVNGLSSSMSAKDFLEWIFINFSIKIEATLYHQATKFLEWASKFIGFKFDFGGEYGKRTRYQQTSLPQLILKVRFL